MSTAALAATDKTVVRIMVVDDHPIVVEGYRQLINRQRNLEVRAVASSAIEALRKAKLIQPNLAVVDIMLKNSSGLDLVKDLKSRLPDIKLLVVSARDESVFAERALHAGACGYVNKEVATTKLIEAIRYVLGGGIYLSENMTSRLLHRAANGNDDLHQSTAEILADRELETFELIGHGLTTREIAARMHLSPKTVDRHRENIKRKLNLNNANELIHHATIWVERNS